MASIKLNFKGDFRRVLLNTSWLKYSELQDKAVQLFPELKGQEYEFSWIDEDGDRIRFSTDEELLDAFNHFLNGKGEGVVKLEITALGESFSTASKSSSTEKVTHANVKCDECGTSPIKGIRYKCAVREDFDLCERCEVTNAQPYPMIKIYHPDQAPLAILVAIKDEEDRPGRHWGPGRHKSRGGRHCGPFGFPHGPPPHGPPEGFPPHGPFGGPRGPHCPRGWAEGGKFGPPPHRQGRWPCFFGQAEAPVPAEASFSKSAESSQTLSDESVEIEQTFIDQAIKLSVEESEAPVNRLAPAEKLRARFVKDVTYPDGTAVQPGTHFLKVWRVRNDGSSTWTPGCAIIPDGGDELCATDVRVNLPELPPGQETDVVVPLVAPAKIGRYVAYFRLQAANGTNFGQRFWANIVVVEDQSTNFDWQVVSGVLSSAPESQDNEPKKAETETAPQIVLESVKVSDIVSRTAASAAEPSALSVVGIPATGNQLASKPAESLNSSESSVKPSGATESRDMATDIWCRVYESELKVLRDMGFTDLSVIIPLLREHVTQPVSRNPELRGQPDAASIQNVVLQLLGSSMIV